MYYIKLLSFTCTTFFFFIHNLETLWPVVKYDNIIIYYIELFFNAPLSAVRDVKKYFKSLMIMQLTQKLYPVIVNQKYFLMTFCCHILKSKR